MPLQPSLRRAALVLALGTAALVSGCNANKDQPANEDVKRNLDQLLQVSRDQLAATRDATAAAKSALEELRKVSARMDDIEKAMREVQGAQKRSAIYLPMETETVCDNDASCANTARAVCNKIGYPKAITSRYTPGTRATLNAVVCFE